MIIELLNANDWNFGLLSLFVSLLILLGTMRYRNWNRKVKERETQHKCGELLHEAFLLCGADPTHNTITSYASKADLNKALHLTNQALSLNPNSSRAYCMKGLYHAGMKQTKQAEECYKKSIRLDRNADSSYYNLAMLLWAKGNKKNAIKQIKKAIKKNSGDADYIVVLGYYYNETGKFSKAEKMYKSAKKDDPENYWVHACLGIFYLEQNRHEEAIDLYKSARLSTGKKWHELSKLAISLGFYDDAEKILRKALEADKNDALVNFRMAHLLILLKRSEEAKSYFLASIQSNPRAFIYLSLHHIHQKDYTGQLIESEILMLQMAELAQPDRSSLEDVTALTDLTKESTEALDAMTMGARMMSEIIREHFGKPIKNRPTNKKKKTKPFKTHRKIIGLVPTEKQ